MQRERQYTVRFKELVATRTDELHHVRQVVEDEAMQFGFNRETAFRLALAVDEACTNVIKHSYSDNPGQWFGIEIATTDNQFVIILTDRGKSFDPNSLPVINMKEYFERCHRGGLGVHIIKLVMDDVAYAVAGKENQLRMVKFLS